MSAQPSDEGVVEVDVSGRCDHECFYIEVGSRSVWHFYGAGGMSRQEADSEDAFVFHDYEHCDPDDPCGCFAEMFDGD